MANHDHHSCLCTYVMYCRYCNHIYSFLGIFFLVLINFPHLLLSHVHVVWLHINTVTVTIHSRIPSLQMLNLIWYCTLNCFIFWLIFCQCLCPFIRKHSCIHIVIYNYLFFCYIHSLYLPSLCPFIWRHAYISYNYGTLNVFFVVLHMCFHWMSLR